LALLAVWFCSFYTNRLSPPRPGTRRLAILLFLLCALGRIEATGPPPSKERLSNSSHSAVA
jgi:hypothetical protein